MTDLGRQIGERAQAAAEPMEQAPPRIDTEQCPHGYVQGDHHWYGCMGFDPFEPAAEPEPGDASTLLDLVNAYAEDYASYAMLGEQRYAEAAALTLDRIAALAPALPVQARDAAGLPWWIHDCGAVWPVAGRPGPRMCLVCEHATGPWRPLLVGGDPAPEIDADRLDEARGDYEAVRAKLREVVAERDKARAEVERLKTARPDPLALRLGRHHGDIVYRQLGDQPSDDDPRVAVFMGPDACTLAAAYVALVNGGAR